MARLIYLFKHIIKKIHLNLMYKKYVLKNNLIQQDIHQTFKVRGCKTNYKSVEKKFYHLMLYYPAFAFIYFWRINKQGHRLKKWYTKNYECKIFGSTNIDGGLVCFHPFATVINAQSIGKNFEYRNGLTIGNKNNDNNLLPIIGNNVTVGANVCIIGKIIIGDNVTIGAGSIVVKDIPSNCIIAGNPARIIKEL
ncbi:MAG: serine acetyltransferase [Flavobacteriales bacterium]